MTAGFSKLVRLLVTVLLLVAAWPSQSYANSNSSATAPVVHTGHATMPKTNHGKLEHIRFGHPPGSHKVAPPSLGPVTYVYPETYGANVFQGTDNLAAIQKAISVAQTYSNGVVAFGLGVYNCSGQLTVNGAGLAGNNSTIMFTNPNSFGVVFTGQHPSIVNLALEGQPGPTFASTTAVTFGSATNFVAKGLVVDFSGGGGDLLDCVASGPGSITSCNLGGTPASALTIRDCNNLTITSNTLANIAVLSGNTTSDSLVISNNNIGTNTGNDRTTFFTKLAGISNSCFTNNTITSGALYLGASTTLPNNPGYADGSVYNVYVANNSIDGLMAVQLGGTQGIVVNSYAAAGNTTNTVSIVSNTLTNINGSSGIFLGVGAANVNVVSNSLKYIGSNGIVSNTGNNINIQGNSESNVSDIPINCVPSYGAGSLSIVNNSIANSCIDSYGPSDLPVIGIGGGTVTPSSVTVTGNYYAGPANSATEYIECTIPSSATARTISGNTQATVLPNKIAP